MIDPEVVDFLTRKRDDAILAVQRAQAELTRCQAALDNYQTDTVPMTVPDEEDGPDPIDIWEPILSTGVGLNRNEMKQALKAAGWARQFEERAFNMAINTNGAVGNIILRDDDRFYKTTPEEKARAMALYREKRGLSQPK